MVDHQKPIEDCEIWDILDWDTVEELSAEATDDPRDKDNLWPWIARQLINAGTQSDHDAEQLLHRMASPALGYGEPAVRRRKAGDLAAKFGADPGRLIDYLTFKWGLFKPS